MMMMMAAFLPSCTTLNISPDGEVSTVGKKTGLKYRYNIFTKEARINLNKGK